MDPSSWQIISVIILVVLSAFFSSAEAAFTSVNKHKLRHLSDDGNLKADRVLKLVENPSKLISTIIVGDNTANIIAAALTATMAMNKYGNRGLVIALAIIIIFIIIFCEIVPRSFSSQKAEMLTLRYVGVIRFFMIILTPFVIIFYSLSSGLLKLFGVNIHKAHPLITEEELKTLVDVGSEEGVLEMDEKEMLFNIFEFGDLQVKDVMVQRVDIIAIDVRDSFKEVLELVKNEQFSRFPVYKEDIDDIVGILNVKDLLFLSDEEKLNFDLTKHIREPYYTYEFKKITELFKELKYERTHMAVILDEYGGTVGIATIEDLLEEIVGEIDDEYDDDTETDIQVIKTNEYIVSGSYRIDELNEHIGTEIESDEFDSIGGYLIGILGTFPENNEVIESDNIKFIVEEVDKNRIKKIRLFTHVDDEENKKEHKKTANNFF